MYCKNCGKEIAEGQVYCEECQPQEVEVVEEEKTVDPSKGKGIAALVGGGGGGRPNMAQAGGKDASKAEAALEAGKAVALSQLG